MGVSKITGFSIRQVRVAALFKALGHPARIAILEFLLEKQSCHCGGLVEELPLAQATISQHLKELKKVGLVKGVLEGPKTCYCINTDVWNEAKGLLASLFSPPVADNECCL